VVESRKTKAELEQEIASLSARVNEKEAVMDRSVGLRRSIAKVESKALRKLLERLIEQLHSAHDSEVEEPIQSFGPPAVKKK
jgi:uncharacterized coiled-coil protein SlyX